MNIKKKWWSSVATIGAALLITASVTIPASAATIDTVGVMSEVTADAAAKCVESHSVCIEPDFKGWKSKFDNKTAETVPNGIHVIIMSSESHENGNSAAKIVKQHMGDSSDEIVSIIMDPKTDPTNAKNMKISADDDSTAVADALKSHKSSDINKTISDGFTAYSKDKAIADAAAKAKSEARSKAIRNAFHTVLGLVGLTILGVIAEKAIKLVRRNHAEKKAQEEKLARERREAEEKLARENRRWGEGFTMSDEGRGLKAAMDAIIEIADKRSEYVRPDDGTVDAATAKRYSFKSRELASSLRRIVEDIDKLFVLMGEDDYAGSPKKAVYYIDFLNSLQKAGGDEYYGEIIRDPDSWSTPDERLDKINAVARMLEDTVNTDIKNYNSRNDNAMEASIAILKDYKNEVNQASRKN